MPPSGVTAPPPERLYPDLTQFYFSEGLQFGPQDTPVEPTSPYQTLLRPDYPLYPELTQLNITEEEVREIDPDYPTDNSNEDVEVFSCIAPDYDLEDARQMNYTVRVNLNKVERKILNDKTFEFLPSAIHPKAQREFHSWMKWRTQVNKQLVAMILIKHGKKVIVRSSELERKPLSTNTIRSVIDNAHSCQRLAQTGLPGKPYIMYGIPRVQLPGRTHQVCM
ncbi:uncharacterized protein LOC124275327 [Haliotis rubra]|uniref:uncharacterized protein LOC124275327 n=1 Tax=Haliotis rubra TaxID=36100 RepID=UPI001EE53625|nr:uncharacterized protein LOC124275327 [Haliotis rubra]